eukprot:COSAG02_NODE_10230_length_1990_cov_4.188789_2_plen_263_part_00
MGLTARQPLPSSCDCPGVAMHSTCNRTSRRLAAVKAAVNASTSRSPAPAPSPGSLATAGASSTARAGRIGIIGGSGPDAGADLFMKVLAIRRAKLGDEYRGDASAPNMLLSQVAAIGGGSADEKWRALSAAIVELAPLVACFSVACNALHGHESKIRTLLVRHGQPPERFVSMTAATAVHCTRLAPSKLVVLGGEVVMDVFGESPYRSLGESLGANVVSQDILGLEQREALWEVIQSVKLHGNGMPESIVRSFESLLRSLDE